MAFQALRGTSDLLADELSRWQTVEQTARAWAGRYGYQEIRTPVIEDAALFQRSVGETSNIVQKEMFVFEDRGGRSIVLRPEGTAAIVRAYLEHHLDKTQGLAKLFYLGPMFRAERPQAGRFRQFHQLGVEALGSSSPWMDAEVITLCVRILETCGVKDLMVLLASMGCRADQQRSAEALRERLASHRAKLCEECQARLDRNVFRILDCKKPSCRALAWEGQGSPFLLCEDCRRHHDTVRGALTQAGIRFDETQTFARGLDYYTRTVFEVRSASLGAQDAVAAGGRYDHLVEEFGGPQVGSVGFAAGVERLLIAAGKQAQAAPAKPRTGLYLAAVKPEILGEVFTLAEQLRRRGVTTLIDADGRSLRAQLREADKLGCRWVVVIGENELRDRQVAVKDLEGGEQRQVSLDELVSERFAC